MGLASGVSDHGRRLYTMYEQRFGKSQPTEASMNEPVEPLQILRIGSAVGLRSVEGDPKPAIVTAVTIRERNKLTYEVAWWSGATRYTAWVEECELGMVEAGGVPIGFKA